jgi:P27 family predicted phage terminase small subunit
VAASRSPARSSCTRATRVNGAIKKEPQPPVEIPDCPPHLDDEARAEWDRIAPKLLGLNLLSDLDRSALAAYCQTYSRWVKAEKIIKQSGEIVRAKGTGNLYPNPYLAVANRALKQMKEFLVEFGMTPSSRVRLGVETEQVPSVLAKFLGNSN